MAIEIVDFPINSMVIFHSYVSSPEGIYWLVVSIPLKNMSQIGSSSQLLGKIKNVPNQDTLWLWLTVRHGFSMALIEIDVYRT